MAITKTPRGRPSAKVPDDEVRKLGKELVEWVSKKITSDDPPVHLTEWYAIEKGMLYPDWDILRNRVEFDQYYHTALDLMALATQKNRKLETAYGSRFLGVYSKDLRRHEKKIAEEKKASQAQEKIQDLVMIKEMLANGDLSQK